MEAALNLGLYFLIAGLILMLLVIPVGKVVDNAIAKDALKAAAIWDKIGLVLICLLFVCVINFTLAAAVYGVLWLMR